MDETGPYEHGLRKGWDPRGMEMDVKPQVAFLEAVRSHSGAGVSW